jgi:integrase
MTDKGVEALRVKDKTYTKSDPQFPGHYVRVLPTGIKSFLVIARDPNGKQVWKTVGDAKLIDIEDARELAKREIAAIKSGADRTGPQTIDKVSDDWLKRHVDAKGLRSRGTIKHYIDNYILKAWSGREFTSIRRGDVAKLLDTIEDKAGPVAADYVLAIVRGICNWYAARHDDYASPIVRGMRRSNPKERQGERTLEDDEIRSVWKQAEANGTFGAFVRLLLLTGQRRDKVATMRWGDISLDGTWNIPTEDREKGTGGELVLPEIVLEIIMGHGRTEGNPYVFAGRGKSHFSGYSKAKAAFDKKVKIAPWVLHDLRRSARSLMSRAGVRPDIAERVLGHVQSGVQGIYDRHAYRDEKAQALRKLSGLIEQIVNPPVGNVVAINAQAQAR